MPENQGASNPFLRSSAPRGKVLQLVLGDYGGATARFCWNRLLHQEPLLIVSDACVGAWDEAVEMAARPRAEGDRMITHRFHAERFAKAFALARQQRRDATRVILEWKI
jgi:threonine dehydrogenase-like Zn-dependent dehydrogenase